MQAPTARLKVAIACDACCWPACCCWDASLVSAPLARAADYRPSDRSNRGTLACVACNRSNRRAARGAAGRATQPAALLLGRRRLPGLLGERYRIDACRLLRPHLAFGGIAVLLLRILRLCRHRLWLSNASYKTGAGAANVPGLYLVEFRDLLALYAAGP
jgi:hypothetical protein